MIANPLSISETFLPFPIGRTDRARPTSSPSVLTASTAAEDANAFTQQEAQSTGTQPVRCIRRHLLTASLRTLRGYWQLPVPVMLEDQDATGDQKAIADILQEFQDLSGLNKAQIGKYFFKVSRTTINNWFSNRSISIDHETTVRGVFEIARLASATHRSQSAMRAWLFTPVGVDAVSPLALIRTGELDRARMLAAGPLPHRETALPDWLMQAPVTHAFARDQRIKQSVIVTNTRGEEIDPARG